MKNWHTLNFNEPFIKDNIVIPESTVRWSTFKVGRNNYITDSGNQYINSLGTLVNYVNLFIGKPFEKTDIHLDNDHQIYALNYVWGSQSSSMVWYKKDSESQTVRRTTANTPYHVFRPNQVTEIDRTNLFNKLTLIRLNTPHAVENYSADYRYCLSLRFIDTRPWEKIVDHLSKFIID